MTSSPLISALIIIIGIAALVVVGLVAALIVRGQDSEGER